MSKYYYLVAQLPFLKFNGDLSITGESFLQEAEKWMERKDFRVLSGVDINDFWSEEKVSRLFRDYKRFELNLRRELLSSRNPDHLDAAARVSGAVKEILALSTPLEIERKLLYLRWKFLEERVEGLYFDLDELVGYFLKIQILERLTTFNKDKGMVAFSKVCEVSVG
ncbi:MAG: DUF2764 family protein [Candidatus Omnitrophota bacterium]|nr:MAG: DUF2764 family protein [Candidatus Omnitrophota bacterium]